MVDTGVVASRVDALEAEERYFEAMDVLNAAGASRDLELARRLLRLRHTAFGRAHPDGIPESWPPALPDPFADPFAEPLGRVARSPGASPPELAPEALTTETVGGSILHHGSVIVRGLASRAEVADLTNGVEHAFAAIDTWLGAAAGDRSEAAASPWFVPFEMAPSAKTAMRAWIREGGGVWAVESPLVAARILDFYRSIGLRQILTGYFGEAPAISVEKLTLRKVAPHSTPSWHQDGSFMGADVRSLNVWLALSDCGGDAAVPGLELVPRRIDELLETGTCGSPIHNSIGHELVERIAGSDTIVRPQFRAGDALFFDDRLVHRTAVSAGMTESRYAIEAWFFAPSTFPADYQGLAF